MRLRFWVATTLRFVMRQSYASRRRRLAVIDQPAVHVVAGGSHLSAGFGHAPGHYVILRGDDPGWPKPAGRCEPTFRAAAPAILDRRRSRVQPPRQDLSL